MSQYDTGPDPGGAQQPLSSVGDILGQITSDLSTLVRQEMQLAKAEARESATRAGRGAGMLGGAAVGAHFVLLFLSIALWWGLGEVTGRAWSAVIVAAIWAVVAAVLTTMGRKEMKKVKGLPQTVATAREVPTALKGDEEIR
jgi:Putative Actinobacterial Holin-X, holin superfamily III